MAHMPLAEFADKVTEIMPVIMREFLKKETEEFYKAKITIPQLVVLDMLVREGELRMSDLARLMNVTTAATTGIVDRLVREGYVARESDAEDRRIIKVRPTAKGIRIVKSANEHKKAIIVKMFSVVSDTEREEYLRILTVVRDKMRDLKS
ncbi:MAG: MarR family transcriptional regulator [Candidatus Omnitrophica bacterium]|nr:MarR family transcriptional regulator [Candidatus Omnitrophota bacterium]MDD5436616.1 MarR family transcriptional regulator [Candidatus Omnitrophota bacterium]